MDKANTSSADAALNRARKLLSRDPEKFRPRLRVRWWNLALLAIIATAIASVIAPLRSGAYRQGFLGNLVSSAWQLIAGAIVGWVVYNRFKAERLNRTMSFFWDDPFREMNKIAISLSANALGEPAELRDALTPDIRKRLRLAAASAQRKGALYGRFLDIERIVDIDEACDAAQCLAELDNQLPDSKFMLEGIMSIRSLHISSVGVCDISPTMTVFESLTAAERKWLR